MQKEVSPELLARIEQDPWWQPQDIAEAYAAVRFSELASLARRIAARMPQPLSIVCGPITSGGLGDEALNLERFSATIALLRAQGWNVFNQLPFESHLKRVLRMPGSWPPDLLGVFYESLFRSGLIRQMLFMPGWQESLGATWEHGRAQALLIPVRYLQDPAA